MRVVVVEEGGGERKRKIPLPFARERERELPSPQITAAFHSPYGPLTPTLHPSRHLRGRPVLLSENDVLY